jgi:hypothetical protein
MCGHYGGESQPHYQVHPPKTISMVFQMDLLTNAEVISG